MPAPEHHGEPWQPGEVRLLGVDTDRAIAERLGRTQRAVESKRRELQRAPHTPHQRHWSAAEVALLGTASDAAIARRLKIWRRTVLRERQRRGVGCFSPRNRPRGLAGSGPRPRRRTG